MDSVRQGARFADEVRSQISLATSSVAVSGEGQAARGFAVRARIRNAAPNPWHSEAEGGEMKAMRVELKEANDFVAKHHRHHKPVAGHRFSIGAEHDGKLVGCVIVGRPVARQSCQKTIAEVTRLVTDGTPNACSFLYAQAARAAKELGFASIQTFILPSESGVSLKASGWICLGETKLGCWQTRNGRRTDQPDGRKVKWQKKLQ